MYIARKDGEVDQDKELRELYITQIQCYAREAIDDLDMLQQVRCNAMRFPSALAHSSCLFISDRCDIYSIYVSLGNGDVAFPCRAAARAGESR